MHDERVREAVTDKGYHSNGSLLDLDEAGTRSYVPEPDRGERDWEGKEEERKAVYANRRRIRGARGKRLLRRRGEYLERSFAHAYETGGMRRVHLRGHDNILKRLLIHLCGFNLSLVMRKNCGKGTPRGWQGHAVNGYLTFLRLWIALLQQNARESCANPADRIESGRCAIVLNSGQKLTC